MSMGGYYSWAESAAEKKARLAKERAAREAEKRETENWREQGYVEITPRRMAAGGVPTCTILGADHARLRDLTDDIEDLISDEMAWTEKDQKRLDKAVVLVKVGAKLIAKVLKANGYVKVRAEPGGSALGRAAQVVGEDSREAN